MIHRLNIYPDTGATRMGGCEILLDLFECFLASIISNNETLFFINLVKGWQRPKKFDINL